MNRARYLIDANVLLNAAFIPQSGARACLDKLCSEKSVILDEGIFLESLRRLRRISFELGIGDIAVNSFNSFLRARNLILLPFGDRFSNHALVNRRDIHILYAVSHYDACLVTEDAELAGELDETGYVAVFPEELVPDAAPVAVSSTLAPEAGLIFARFSLGDWVGNREPTKFYLFDAAEILTLYFDNNSKRFVLKLDMGPQAQIQLVPEWKDGIAICGQYRFGREGGLRPFVGKQGCDRSSRFVKTPKKPKIWKQGGVSIGSDRFGQHQWQAAIQSVLFGNNWISQRAWRALLKRGGSPRFGGSGGLLREALKERFADYGMAGVGCRWVSSSTQPR